MPQKNVSIHFFRLRFDCLSRLISEVIPDLNQVVKEIQNLKFDIQPDGSPDTSKSSRFMIEDEDDYSYLYCDIQNDFPPYLIRFARIRQTEIEVLHNGKFDFANFASDIFPTQTTYAVCFQNGVIGVCFNKSGPKFDQITTYIREKVQGTQNCSCGELLRYDTFERLQNMKGLSKLELKFYSSFADNIFIQGVNVKPVNSPSIIELNIRSAGYSSQLDNSILINLQNLLLSVGVPQSLVKAKLTGSIFLPGSRGKNGKPSLLQESIEQGVIDVMKRNFIIKSKVKLDPVKKLPLDKYVFETISETYNDQEVELQKAVEAMR